MAVLNNSSTAPWNETLTVQKQFGTKVTLNTATKYVEEDIELNFNVKQGSANFSGGSITNTDATASFTNMKTSTSNTSGIKITARGTAERQAITSSGIAGWITPSNLQNDFVLASKPVSSWTGQTYYVTGVTLTNGKTFDITVPNGANGTVTFHFAVDANGNTTIT